MRSPCMAELWHIHARSGQRLQERFHACGRATEQPRSGCTYCASRRDYLFCASPHCAIARSPPPCWDVTWWTCATLQTSAHRQFAAIFKKQGCTQGTQQNSLDSGWLLPPHSVVPATSQLDQAAVGHNPLHIILWFSLRCCLQRRHEMRLVQALVVLAMEADQQLCGRHLPQRLSLYVIRCSLAGRR